MYLQLKYLVVDSEVDWQAEGEREMAGDPAAGYESPLDGPLGSLKR